jgi:hypothetical protein
MPPRYSPSVPCEYVALVTARGGIPLEHFARVVQGQLSRQTLCHRSTEQMRERLPDEVVATCQQCHGVRWPTGASECYSAWLGALSVCSRRHIVSFVAPGCADASTAKTHRGAPRLPIAAGAVLVVALALASSGLAAAAKATSATSPELLFDDFNYSGFNKSFELWHHGWKIRSAQGWPGIAGAGWSPTGISFVRDPVNRSNWLLRLTSSTDGTPGGTVQAQICQQRKFFEGTYAARIRFSDVPDAGSDVDQLVETFYAISPLRAPLDPNYSELDWEYLPNGGWGVSDATLFVTSWETAPA